MNIATTTIVGYAAASTFMFWYIPFITRNRASWLWFPSRVVHFLFGDSTASSVVALIVQIVVPAALVCWVSVLILHTLFPA